MPKTISTMEQMRESEEKRRERNRRKNAKKATNTRTYTVRVYHGSALETATEKAASDAGIQPGRYLRKALVEKLTREGYIAETEEEEEEEEE